ncbi:MAG: cohesin domain-containing protein [Patescibacteria group bacterium]|jgi:hypothetical protein|nr:cohesin domain-containing protein [Patescibacteria group bacterium]
MKLAKKLIGKLFIISSVAIITLYSLPINAAEQPTGIYFNNPTLSVKKDGVINVVVKANAPNYNGATIDITYDPSSLQYIQYEKGTALSSEAKFSASPGIINLTLFTFETVSGNNNLVSFSFKALKDSGETPISFNTDKTILATDLGEVSKVAGANGGSPMKIVFEPTAVPVKDPDNSNVALVSAPSDDKQAPAINSNQPAGFIGKTINIALNANENSFAVVNFGIDKQSLKETVSQKISKDTPNLISLGELSRAFEKDKTYYYKVTVTDPSGNQTTSQIQEIVMTPVKIEYTAKNKSDELLKNTTLLINNEEFQTNDKGVVKIEDAIPGVLVIYHKNGSNLEYLGEATVVAGANYQTFESTPTGIVAGETKSKSAYSFMLAIPIIMLVAIVMFVAFRIIKNRQSTKTATVNMAPINPEPTVDNNQPNQGINGQTMVDQNQFVIKPNDSETVKSTQDINNQDITQKAKDIVDNK